MEVTYEQSNFNGQTNKRPRSKIHTNKQHIGSFFSLAVNRRFARQGEERQADFINIVAWNKTGEFVSKYFKKGQQVAVIGRLQTRTWDDDKGQKHYITEVIAEEAYFADSKRDGATGDFGASFGTDATGSAGESSEFEVSSGDDLPF